MYFAASIFLIALPIVESDPAITDSQVRYFDLITMLTYLVPLSISSLCAFLKLRSGCLQAEQFSSIRKKMLYLEVLI